MGIKYYHSAPQQVRCGIFLADAEGKKIADLNAKSVLIKNLPRVTVCSVLDGNKLSFGYATCSSKEQYNKKRGQRISYARAIGKPYAVYEREDLADVHEVSARVVEEIFNIETKRIYG